MVLPKDMEKMESYFGFVLKAMNSECHNSMAKCKIEVLLVTLVFYQVGLESGPATANTSREECCRMNFPSSVP